TFSAAGITISKHCNRLKGDIVEALQCLKCLYHNDLIFREVLVSSDIESWLEMDEVIDIDVDSHKILECAEEFSWDQLIGDEDDEDIVA
ncbi:hypothetical protein BDZ97DRAFT_1677628, partial [Flammula alnicola]